MDQERRVRQLAQPRFVTERDDEDVVPIPRESREHPRTVRVGRYRCVPDYGLTMYFADGLTPLGTPWTS
jgi:hypothetical protein